ncbi:MAG: sigma 54-interacting transcriptional regulator [Myxococcales bacterium]
MTDSAHDKITGERALALASAEFQTSRAVLVIHAAAGPRVVELPRDGTLLVGRRWPSDVVLDDTSLSRQHANFAWVGAEVWVEDLVSRNGVVVGGLRVKRARVKPGQHVLLGDVHVSLHLVAPSHAILSGFDTFEQWHSHLCEEIERARILDDQLAVLMFCGVGHDVEHACRMLRERIRPLDRLAFVQDGRVLIMLPSIAPPQASKLFKELLGVLTECGRFSGGMACFPEAENAEELVAAARHRCDHDLPEVVARPSTQPPTAELSDAEAAKMARVMRLADQAAVVNVPVLITGETGVGKEVLARRIHQQSGRMGPLKAVNCAAIPASLVESVLFGHVKGAFTGADRASLGVFRTAERGTVLLDEIGDLPLPAQAALLRTLESKTVTPVGSAAEVEVDFRLIAATHRDLEAMAVRGEFRSDLLYRINAITLFIPPLRERGHEIDDHAIQFMETAARGWGKSVHKIGPKVLERLRAYPWPGNLRELRNVIEHAVVVAEGPIIQLSDLPARLQPDAEAELDSSDSRQADGAFRERVRSYETRVIREALSCSDGNVTRAASQLQLPLRTLVYKMRLYGVRRSD